MPVENLIHDKFKLSLDEANGLFEQNEAFALCPLCRDCLQILHSFCGLNFVNDFSSANFCQENSEEDSLSDNRSSNNPEDDEFQGEDDLQENDDNEAMQRLKSQRSGVNKKFTGFFGLAVPFQAGTIYDVGQKISSGYNRITQVMFRGV